MMTRIAPRLPGRGKNPEFVHMNSNRRLLLIWGLGGGPYLPLLGQEFLDRPVGGRNAQILAK